MGAFSQTILNYKRHVATQHRSTTTKDLFVLCKQFQAWLSCLLLAATTMPAVAMPISSLSPEVQEVISTSQIPTGKFLHSRVFPSGRSLALAKLTKNSTRGIATVTPSTPLEFVYKRLVAVNQKVDKNQQHPKADIIAQTDAAIEKLNRGLQLIQQGKVTEAIAAFQQAAKLDPKLAPAHYNLGLALRQQGQLQPAANAFYQATQADPKFALAYANLGAALLEGNNFKQAKDYLERAIQIDPKLGVGYYNLGLVYEQSRNWDKAIAAFKRAIQFSPKAPEPAYHLGLVYMQQKNFADAKRAFQQALQITPNYPEANYNLGSILLSQGNLNAALDYFRKAAEANSNYANAYYAAGVVFLRQGKHSDAQKVLQYARDLFKKQGNTQWVTNTEQLLQKAKNHTAN